MSSGVETQKWREVAVCVSVCGDVAGVCVCGVCVYGGCVWYCGGVFYVGCMCVCVVCVVCVWYCGVCVLCGVCLRGCVWTVRCVAGAMCVLGGELMSRKDENESRQ